MREKYSKWKGLVGKGREQATFQGANSTAVGVIYLIICRSAWTEDLITFSVLMSGSMDQVEWVCVYMRMPSQHMIG